MKKLSNHHPVQQRYKNKKENYQDSSTYAKGWLLFIIITISLLVFSWFFGGTFMPPISM